METYCIGHFAILVLSVLFYHAKACSIECPDNERPCGNYDELCQGFVGCSLPEECICDRSETGLYLGPSDDPKFDEIWEPPAPDFDPKDFIHLEENCRIIKSSGRGKYIPFIDNSVLGFNSSIFIRFCMWIQLHFINS